MADSSKTAKGGMLVGIAAIITACIPLFLAVTSDSSDKAEKADDKAELVLDLFRDRFNAAQAERARIQRELEYQRGLNAKLFGMVANLRKAPKTAPEVEEPKPVHRPKPTAKGSSGSDLLSKALQDLSAEDQFDLPEPPPAAPAQMEQKQLPRDLEELVSKK